MRKLASLQYIMFEDIDVHVLILSRYKESSGEFTSLVCCIVPFRY